MRFRFEDFELDSDAFELTRAGEPVRVEPQVFGVLLCLLERHDRLVSRDELLDQVWGTRFVSDATVASRVKAARRAIGDDGTSQRLIRTVTGRGYRFVGRLGEDGARLTPPRRASAAAAGLVGREAEAASLGGQLQIAQSGAARIVLVTGEAGSGKTTVVEAFTGQLGPEHRVWVGRCIPTSGIAEAYWPFLDALSSAARADPAVVDALSRVAPTWLAQLPLPRTEAEAATLGTRTLGATQGRIVRELVATLEMLCDSRSTVMLLEDLHWADAPSLDLLDALVRVGINARLLVVGTVRPGERHVDALVDQLVSRDLVAEVALAPLSESDIAAYVRRRAGATLPDWLAPLLAERTGGNALFARCLLDSWLGDERLSAAGEVARVFPTRDELARDVPATVHRLIGSQLELLRAEDRLVLDAASVAGVRFSAAEVAAATGRSLAETEDALTLLATDTRLIRADGSAAWPDGTRAARHAFVHELYRDVLYERLAPGRRAAMHGSVGRSLELAYAGTAEPYFAARLAHHFTEAGDPDRSVRYLQAAAAQSLARSAHAEAARQATAALEMLGATRARGDSAGDEITLRTILAVAQTALRGWADPEIEAGYERARQLCETTDPSRLPPVVYGLATLHEYRGAYDRSEALMAEHLESGGEELVPEALELLACSTFHQGRFARSLSFAEQALATYDVSLTSEYLARFGESPAVNYHCWAALSLWFLGREPESLEHLHAALEVAEHHVYSRTTAQSQAAFLHQFRGDAAETRRWADTTLDVAHEHGFPFRTAQATILRGWAIAAAGESDRGAGELHRGLELYRATGAGMDLPYYLGLQAEVELLSGRRGEALALVEEAQAAVPKRGFFYEPQLLVLEARLRSETDAIGAAELLTRAAAVADGQAAPRTSAEISTLLDRLRADEPIGREDLLESTDARS